MIHFFPNHIAYTVQLLDKYSEFVASKASTGIAVIPILLERIKKLRDAFQSLRDKEGLTEPDQLQRNLRSFRILLMELEVLECLALPVVTHYQEEFDGYLTALFHELCHEIGCPVSPPHVCALSTGNAAQGRDYYWYFPEYSTIFVPTTERFSRLNLPDLLHELSHHILVTYKASFIGPLRSWFLEYHAETERKLLLQGISDPNRLEASQAIFLQRWPAFWSEEVVCDAMAAYCVGQAYGWTNLKLCQSYPPDLSYDIYHYSDTHPPDAYRMDVILAMLKHLGIEAKGLKSTWDDYVKTFRRTKPALYGQHFPKDLVDRLIPHVFETCQDIGLIPCTERLNEESTIISKLDTAWNLFLRDPHGLREIEDESLLK
ncbi:MAG: hypothetical protein HY731_09475 [Candidatus Tectomicrobia bacterium]|nr:hypothetical protein [Candidatus Tectomicrobia bacterium]